MENSAIFLTSELRSGLYPPEKWLVYFFSDRDLSRMAICIMTLPSLCEQNYEWEEWEGNKMQQGNVHPRKLL